MLTSPHQNAASVLPAAPRRVKGTPEVAAGTAKPDDVPKGPEQILRFDRDFVIEAGKRG